MSARAAAEAVGDGILGFYLRESAMIDRIVAQALKKLERDVEAWKFNATEWEKIANGLEWTAKQQAVELAQQRAEIAHRLRLIFKDAATFYEINECLAFANELDPTPQA